MSQDVFVIIEHFQGNISEISYTMLAAARDLSSRSGGGVAALLLGHNIKNLAADLAADHVWVFEHQALADFTGDAYVQVLGPVIQEKQPAAVLMGSTSIGADIASVLSARLNLPLISLCQQFDDGRYISQICGGKIMAEGALASQTNLVTMIPGGYSPDEGRSSSPPEITAMPVAEMDAQRISFSDYVEPEVGDVDISEEPILIAIGRGVQTEDNIELADELAELMEGAVCASRPVIDQGWLSSDRLVGKSGKSVRPKLYLAMGISGAPEHVESITDSELIVAVNLDPDAPIFDIAQYGAEMDMLDLTDALIEKIEEIKDA